MKWNNADKDPLPGHNQEVLVSVEGIYFITIYDEPARIFRLKAEPDETFIVGNHLIYWTEISNP